LACGVRSLETAVNATAVPFLSSAASSSGRKKIHTASLMPEPSAGSVHRGNKVPSKQEQPTGWSRASSAVEDLVVVALLSRTELFSEAMRSTLEVAPSRGVAEWKRAASQLVRAHECIGAPGAPCEVAGGAVRVARPVFAGQGTVLRVPWRSAERGVAPEDIPTGLAAHPLWRAMLPLFSDRVQRGLQHFGKF